MRVFYVNWCIFLTLNTVNSLFFLNLRENSEFGSYPGSYVPVLCPSDYCGSSSKKVKYFTGFMKNIIKIIHSMYNKKLPFILRPLYKCICNLKFILRSRITLTNTCFLIPIILTSFRQIRRTTESSKAATPMSRSIFYMINNNEDSTFITQNEYEQLRISSLHVYNDLSLKLIPAPTSYINLSSLKWRLNIMYMAV